MSEKIISLGVRHVKKQDPVFNCSDGLAIRPKQDLLVFNCSDGVAICPKHRLRLMRQHNWEDIFQRGNIYKVKHSHIYATVQGTNLRVAVPIFRHPHDKWVRQNEMFETYQGEVLSVNKGQGNFHLLVKLAPNVLAFAEAEHFDEGQRTVEFIPYRYNRNTKKIYGIIK